MAGNDLGAVAGHCQRLFAGADHAADRAAGALVNERIHGVEPDIAHVQHIGLVEVDVNVGIGVRRLEVHQVDLRRRCAR